MTGSSEAQPTADAAPEAARHEHMPSYVIVFADDRPPKQCAFSAISDEAAVELMRKQYPRLAWTLYHAGADEQPRERVHAYPGWPSLGTGSADAAGSMA